MPIQRRHILAAATAAFLACFVNWAHADEVNPQRFTVAVEGQGPDVILIPGRGSSRETYAAEASHLRATHRLHLVQINGFAGQPAGANAQGEIIAPFVEELDQYIKAQHLDHPAVIGHSMGGLAGLMLARRHPEDLSRLLVVDALPFFSVLFHPAATVENVTPQAAGMRDQVIALPDANFAAMQQAGVARLVLNPDNRPTIAAWTLASDRAVFARAMYEDMTTDMRSEIAQIQTPITVLYAYDTTMGPQAGVDALWHNAYASAPHATLTRIDGSYHFIMFDQPAAFDTAVQTFLR